MNVSSSMESNTGRIRGHYKKKKNGRRKYDVGLDDLTICIQVASEPFALFLTTYP